MSDTIAAISTAFGEGAVALLRLSGPRALEMADTLWRGRQPVPALPARYVAYGRLEEQGSKLDDVLLTVFRAPASYTGEDVVEIACHGGVLVSRSVLGALLRAGARAAEPGEFTRRAFRHGKLDLTQAEAVMDVVRAQTTLALRAAQDQLSGALGSLIRTARASLLEVQAQVEAALDFPEEDIAPETGAVLRARVAGVQAEADRLLRTAAQGRVLREGLRAVIFGEPNVGKSSLLNRLLGFERAIVSARPGTTRDVIEETIVLQGVPVRLLETAGLRESDDEIEQAGMARTRRAVDEADLVLHVYDASQPPPEGGAADDGKMLAVLNKGDLGEHPSWSGVDAVRISCATGTGLDALSEAIAARAMGGAAQEDWSLAINARHQACLEAAAGSLRAVLEGLDDGRSMDLVAEDLRAAMEAIGDIVGRPDTEELLGIVFGQFCIGK
jgi:tRNA modification GTPase